MRPAAPSLTRITACNGPWPLHDSAASRQAEHAALATAAPHALMQAGGLAVARAALALAPHAQRVQVWAGPGNNGGDGLVAARHLHAAGKQVQVAWLGDPAQLPADAAAALAQAQAAGVRIERSARAPAPAPELVIDALLGLGISRAPEGPIAAAIASINASAARVLAVDLPSGLHADTGAALGAAAVHATATLALLTLKPGCFTHLGRDHCGEIWLATLGVDAGAPSAWLGAAPTLQTRTQATHKGSYGDVAVVGGAQGMVGAAWLAARAALAAGAGRVYCSPLDPAADLLAPLHPELMGRHAWWAGTPQLLRSATVACGCGGGDRVRDALPPLLSQVPRLVLDADALNAVAADTLLQTLLQQRAPRGLATLLTPHPLEAARLLQTTTAAVQANRITAAQRLADRYGCTVLLKGSGSVIAARGRLPVINPSGNAALATAGTGDVLAGWAAGLWAQAPQAHADNIAQMAAWQHGRAADLWPAAARGAPLRASDLVEALAQRCFD